MSCPYKHCRIIYRVIQAYHGSCLGKVSPETLLEVLPLVF